MLVNERTVVFRVAASGDADAPHLGYTLFAEQPIDAPTAKRAAAQIAWFLGLNDDLRPFYAIGKEDEAFATVIERLRGYHQVKFLTPFENASWAVLTQRNTIASARVMKQALINQFGGALNVDGACYEAFPNAAPVAAADPAALEALIRHAQKARYLHAVAEAFANIEQAWLRNAPYDEVEAWLRNIKGIGAWSATFIMLRGLGRMERVPMQEKTLDRVMAQVYNHGVPLAPDQITRLAERYGDQAGYWAHYLRVGGEA